MDGAQLFGFLSIAEFPQYFFNRELRVVGDGESCRELGGEGHG